MARKNHVAHHIRYPYGDAPKALVRDPRFTRADYGLQRDENGNFTGLFGQETREEYEKRTKRPERPSNTEDVKKWEHPSFGAEA